MTERERIVKQISQLDHVKSKSMWVGCKEIQTTKLYVIDDIENPVNFVLDNIKFAPAWYKIVDEIVVNAVDQYVNFPKKVNTIKIDFNHKNGVIKIYNNGPSIGIYETKNLQGIKMYAPQLIASEFLSGDNLDDTDRITGGTNGAGLKLTNAFSEYLTLKTVDMKVKKYYEQTFKNRLLVINEPIIRKLNNNETESYTEIEFLPCYTVFGYTDGYTPNLAKDLYKLILSRAYQVAAFTDINIYCNNDTFFNI